MAMDFYDPIDQYGAQTTFAPMSGLWTAAVTNTLASFIVDSQVAVDISTAWGRFPGRYGVRLISNRGDTGGAIYRNIGTNYASLYFSVSLFFPSIGGSYPFMSFGDASTSQISFIMDGAGHVNIYRLTTLLQTGSGPAVSANAWHRFEFFVTIDPSVGVATCKVDGVVVNTVTGANTRATANSWVNQVMIGGGIASGQVYVVDPICYSSTGAVPNGFLGDKRFYTGFPSGNGAVQQYAQNTTGFPAGSPAVKLGYTLLDSNGNLQRVTTAGTLGASAPTWNASVGGTTTSNTAVFTNIDVPASHDYNFVNEQGSDDDANYLSDATVNHEEGFTMPAIPSNVTGIIGAGIMLRSRKDDAGTRSLRTEYKSGATVADNGADLVQTTTWQNFPTFFPNDPNTSAAWNVSGINAAEPRVKTTA
jgi:hypothetical protein